MEQDNKVILVDLKDRELGLMEKMEAHERGLLHRAFSVFLFRGDQLLMQKRAGHKYHCGGLWTNTCCSHPRSGETVEEAAYRRLKEELGIHLDDSAKPLKEIGAFAYRAAFENGLTEFEYDHVLVGEYDGDIAPDREEVEDVRWVRTGRVLADLQAEPGKYTPWFITALALAVREKGI